MVAPFDVLKVTVGLLLPPVSTLDELMNVREPDAATGGPPAPKSVNEPMCQAWKPEAETMTFAPVVVFLQ